MMHRKYKIKKLSERFWGVMVSFLIFFAILSINPVSASPIDNPNKFMSAEVVEVLRQQKTMLPDGGGEVEQQDLKLKILEGSEQGRTVLVKGIGNFDVAAKNLYRKGDKVVLLESSDADGSQLYFATDYIRTSPIAWLTVFFLLAILAIGRWKGIGAVVSLVLSFLIMIKFIIPGLLHGQDPVIITLIGSAVILLLIVYLTEGWKTRSHLAVISIFTSLMFTVFLSRLFIIGARLTGIESEETGLLVAVAGQNVDFAGLLLAGIIIGALGVLDDVVISQISAVEELHQTDPSLSARELFSRAFRVGRSHISSMVNTLFLAYAGASLPVLILLASNSSPFGNWTQILSNESIATEIIRTLTGSIGLILSVPISTGLAAWQVKQK